MAAKGASFLPEALFSGELSDRVDKGERLKKWKYIEKGINKKILLFYDALLSFLPSQVKTLFSFPVLLMGKLQRFAGSFGLRAVAELRDFGTTVATSMREAGKEKRKGGRPPGVVTFFKIFLLVSFQRVVDIIDKIGFVKVSVFFLCSVLIIAYSIKDVLFWDPMAVYDEYSLDNPRPSYYKREERTLRISNVIIPIYIDSVNSYKKLEIEASVVSSNKYIKEFFYNNMHHVHDALNSNMEPVVPTFPLEGEGKQVLADKIKDELNKLITRLGIKGEIRFVYIHYMFAG